MAKIELTIRINDGPYMMGACVDVEPYFQRAFAPIRMCDQPLIAHITGDETVESAKKILKLREDAAEHLAAKLTRMLVQTMKGIDTTNGERR